MAPGEDNEAELSYATEMAARIHAGDRYLALKLALVDPAAAREVAGELSKLKDKERLAANLEAAKRMRESESSKGVPVEKLEAAWDDLDE